ncbi:MAG: site-2 protease family protein [Candidatus Obscuribacter phosphatis]|uniref:Site-2 protease family protein n=1 Tax=Candidatus Obscuribacter phosphatis TaxID=1906157 RepID=A0A8J7TMJ1_9BACT|nr:site-2 protease family protein [Candidatus Obscuribacter phosphatis]
MNQKPQKNSVISGLLALVAIVATKGKVLLGAILKVKGLGTFISMVISMVGYWWAWNLGFWGAFGFVALIWIHEMGHVLAARKIGLPVSAPVFVPFLGALIRMKELPKNAKDEAIMAMGGPLLGALGAFACLGIWQLNGDKLWLWLAGIGMLINLFNLIPVAPLDGGRIATLFGRGFWWAGLAALVVLSFVIEDSLLILFAVLGLLEIDSRFTRLPRWVFLVPVVLALAHGIYFEQYLVGGILALLNLLLVRGKLLGKDDGNEQSEPTQDASFFEVSAGAKAVILSAYLAMVLILGATFWWLASISALVR